MKQRNKATLIIGLSGFFYLALIFLIPGKNFLSILALSIAFFLITVFAVYSVIIRQVEKLNLYIINLCKKNILSHRIPIHGNDEISSISANMNTLLDKLQANYSSLENQVKYLTQELEEKNTLLQREISVKKHNQKLMVNRDYLMKPGKRNDDLTLLPNGFQFNETLNKAIIHSQRHHKILSVLLINIDLFKLVQDTFGPDNGDLILKEITRRIQSSLRKEDILAKLEGDEFIILLTDIGKPKFSSMVATKILNACSQNFKVDSHEFNVTASIGISIYPNDGNSLEELIENADRALFKAKQSGGNTYQFYSEDIHLEAMEYIQLESALHKAIQCNELALYYQPRFRVNSGNISAVEVFMRWEHPELGIIRPEKFIQVAEESGLILKIGEWALKEICQRISFWQNEGYEHMTVALKLSPVQFNHPDMAKVLTKILGLYNINPEYLELQITEQTVMENIESSFIILNNLKATGVQLSIDHFGTGYTVISYLKQFPLSAIKIDKSFIKGIPLNPNDIDITSAIIALAHKLGIEVMAEGVETAEQVQFLSREGCDIVQGYYFSHPLSAQKIALQFKKIQDEVLR